MQERELLGEYQLSDRVDGKTKQPGLEKQSRTKGGEVAGTSAQSTPPGTV